MEEKEILKEAAVLKEEAAEEIKETEQANEEKPEEETAADGEAESTEAEAKPAKRSKVLHIIMYVLTGILAAAAITTVSLVVHVHSMIDKCADTKLPSGMTAEETLRQYFSYWDDGNNVGMQLAALPDSGSAASVSKNYVMDLDLLCSIKLTGVKKLSEDDWRYGGCYDRAAFEVDFRYTSHFGAGDKELDGENKGWRFYLAKINEDDDWKIYSVIKPGSEQENDEDDDISEV
ncbi:MAG: hypothetical protein IKO44_04870 [Ruminococcus sp.]|nr:hypothetical protein [Ruminococcus sp.]MBR4622854.1 hypothetical protein [Ruminococcus sp.]